MNVQTLNIDARRRGNSIKEEEKNARVIAFEIDERMHEYLDKLESDNIKVIYEDILKVNCLFQTLI